MSESASAFSAASKRTGNFLLRRFDRLKMPSAAFAESKYFSGGFVSKTCDNEHLGAALRDSEVLRVQYRPRNTVPEFIQTFEDDLEVAPAIAG